MEQINICEMKTEGFKSALSNIIEKLKSSFLLEIPYRINIDTRYLTQSDFSKENLLYLKKFINLNKKNPLIKKNFKECIIKVYSKKAYLFFFSIFTLLNPLTQTTIILLKTNDNILNPIYKKHTFMP